MKKRILCAILSLVAVFSLVGFNATEAWFSDGENKILTLKSGKLDFSATGNISLKDKEAVVLPGTTLELEEAIVITNNSTIDTELRILVECIPEGGAQEDTSSWINFEIEGDSNWVSEDGYIYYRPGGNGIIPPPVIPETTTIPEVSEITTAQETTTEEVAVAADEETTTEAITETTTTRVYASNEIPFAGTMIISGKVPPEYNGKTMKINFVLQAKQADLMEWKNFDNPYGMPTTTVSTTASTTSAQ